MSALSVNAMTASELFVAMEKYATGIGIITLSITLIITQQTTCLN
jgi:hypothetical protein